MLKNPFYFTSKAFFVLRIFNFLSWFFGLAVKRLDKKDKVNFKIYDVTAWLTNKCNTHISQYLEKCRQSGNEIWSVNRLKREKHFSSKIIHKMWCRNYSQTLLWIIFLDQLAKVSDSIFLLCTILRAIKTYWN